MAIVYSYPKVTSPLATDVLVITDTTVTAGKRKNKTKSIAMSDVATYIVDSKSAITGSGTLNTVPMFTPDGQKIGDSIITCTPGPNIVTIGGRLQVDNDLVVAGRSTLVDYVRFVGAIQDGSGLQGTSGQVLTSTGTGVAWATNASSDTTYDLTGAVSGGTGFALSLTGSDGTLDKVQLLAGTNITLTDNGSNGVTIASSGTTTGTGTTNYVAKWNTSNSIQDSIIFDNGTNVGVGTATPSAKLHVNGQTAFLVTDGNETGLEINNGSYIYKIGDISGGENQVYMQIDSAASKAFFLNSNVGIGTNSPEAKLDVESEILISGTDPILRMERGDGFNSDIIKVESSTDNIIIGDTSLDEMIFEVDTGEAMRINNAGRVGIGTMSPSDNLEIGTNGSADTAFRMYSDQSGKYFRINSGGNFTALRTTGDQNLIIESSGTAGYVTFQAGNSERMRVNYNGNVGIGTTNPSQKLEISEGYISSSGAGTSHGFELKRSGLDTYRLRHLDSGLTVFNDTDSRKEMTFNGTGNVGIGTSSPASKLTITGGDAEVTGSDKGLILESPNGTRYRIKVDNSGNLTTTAV